MFTLFLKKAVFVLIFLASFPSFSFAGDSSGKLKVVATIFPTYDFCRRIGRDKIELALLLPPGVEPHAFEPRPSDILRIHRADVFVYTGKYMEPWVQEILEGIAGENLLVVDASEGVHLLGKDPHIWLDFDNARIMVDNISTAFSRKDPANREFYLDNARQYKERLEELDGEFRQAIAGCKSRLFIYAGHFAFGYLARRYGLKYASPYRGFSPNAEPTPKAVAELITKMREGEINYIYYEELIDPKVARMIAAETGARLLKLSAAHNVSREELLRGVTFIEIMQEDLSHLKLGLSCR